MSVGVAERVGWRRPRRPGRRLLAGLAVLLAAAAVVIAVAVPFGGGSGSSGGVSGNGAATSLATVTQRSLSSQVQVDGTLGYSDPSTIVAPAGTAPSDLQKAQQAVAAAQAALQASESALAADTQALEQAQAKLAADRLKQASDCRGDSAAASASPTDAGSTPCATAAQAAASDEQAVTSAKQKVASDTGQVSSGRTTLSAAEQSLEQAESSAAAFGASAAYTMLPEPGAIVRRGRPLYAVDGEPVLLLYGSTAAWRPFRPGMSSGRDVSELNRNLRALGYGSGLTGDSFTSATEQAVRSFQAAHGLEQTGSLPLGSVVFEPGAVRVTSVTPTVGAAVQPGPVLAITSTTRQITIALDAAQQAQVEVGDPVMITLPSNRTTAGRVSFVGSVATTPSGSDASSTPTIEVDVTPRDPGATGRLDQAPVQVSITTASVKNALVVPVNALLALAGGGYGLETVDGAGVHRLIAVTLGLFDDAEGLVAVSGPDVRAGQHVVVPGS
jgi:peptidoglycan hydrolase-like protein with peptidoglycan-binding domain